MDSSYASTACRERPNASDQLREILRVRICHFAESQQLINDDKTSIKKLGFDAIAVVVQKPRVLYLHSSQVCLNHQSITWIAVNQILYQMLLMHMLAGQTITQAQSRCNAKRSTPHPEQKLRLTLVLAKNKALVFKNLN